MNVASHASITLKPNRTSQKLPDVYLASLETQHPRQQRKKLKPSKPYHLYSYNLYACSFINKDLVCERCSDCVVYVPIEELVVQLRSQPVVVRRRDIQETGVANLAVSHGWLFQQCAQANISIKSFRASRFVVQLRH